MVLKTSIAPEVEKAWQKLIDEKSGDEVQWLLAKYESAKSIVLAASGQGGRKQCLENIPENQVVFGGFRVTAVDEDGASSAATNATVQRDESGESGSYRTKIIFFLYQNPGASMMAKARASSDRGSVQGVMKNSTCQFQIESIEEEFSEDEIAKKLNSVIAKPDRYDFDNKIHRGRLQFDEPDPVDHDLNHANYQPPQNNEESTQPPQNNEESTPAPAAVLEEEQPKEEEPPEEALSQPEAPTEEEESSSAAVPTESQEKVKEEPPADVIPPPIEDKKPTVKKASPDSHAILLFTSVPASPVIEGDQNFIRQTFTGRKIPFVELDGMDAEKKEERNKLFGISGLRGKYPQVFVQLDGEISFIGDFDKMNELNDCDTLPPDILSANPQIDTLTSFRSIPYGLISYHSPNFN